MSILRDTFKGPMGAAWDLARIAGGIVILAYTGLTIAAFITGKPFDHIAVGTGFAALLAGVAAFIWTKDNARTAAVSQGKQDATAAGEGP